MSKGFATREQEHLTRETKRICDHFGVQPNQALEEALAGLCGGGSMVTLPYFAYIFDSINDVQRRLGSAFTIAKAREIDTSFVALRDSLVEDIIELLTVARDARDLRNERQKMQQADWTIEKLLERKWEVIGKQRAAGKTVEQLKAEIKPSPLGYPKMPTEIVLQGEVTPRRLDADLIMAMVKRDSGSDWLRSLNRRYSAEQVNARLHGEF